MDGQGAGLAMGSIGAGQWGKENEKAIAKACGGGGGVVGGGGGGHTMEEEEKKDC
jgi:hypothetical protein